MTAALASPPVLEAVCMSCKVRMPIDTLVNNAWHGWKLNKRGESVATKIDNLCCPTCGTNDIRYVSPFK